MSKPDRSTPVEGMLIDRDLWLRTKAERDELRAQNDRMAGECAAAGDKIAELRAEIERLKGLLSAEQQASHDIRVADRAEIERLRPCHE